MFSEASYNPTGSYVRFFDLEEALIGKRVILSFEGAEQAIYVWINGEFVGYAEDSFTVSEFDITPYVKETGNRLCVEVLWSSIFVTLMANKIGGLQFGIYRNCQISSRVFHTAVAALPLTKANRSDFE